MNRTRTAINEHHAGKVAVPHPQDLMLQELASASLSLKKCEATCEKAVEVYRELDVQYKRDGKPTGGDSLELLRAAMLDAQDARQDLRLAERRFESACQTMRGFRL